MINIVSIFSNSHTSGKTTIAFNLINVIPSDLKVLLVELDYTSPFLKLKNAKNKTNNTKLVNYGSPFGIHEYSNKCNIISPIKKHLLDEHFEDLIKTNINNWKKNYDVILFDTNSSYTRLLKLSLYYSNIAILIYDVESFTNNKILDDFKLIRTSQHSNSDLKLKSVIINNYDEANINHINNLLQIQNVFASQDILITLPIVKSLYPISIDTLDYAKKTPWSQYAINLTRVINKILEK